MAASPSNIIGRVLGSEGAVCDTETLIRAFMLNGYGMSKAHKRIKEYATMGIIYKNESDLWEMTL